MGREGFELFTSNAAQTGAWSGLIPIEPTVFTSITGHRIAGTWLSKTIPAGFPLVGNITGFQISSGSVVAYNARA